MNSYFIALPGTQVNNIQSHSSVCQTHADMIQVENSVLLRTAYIVKYEAICNVGTNKLTINDLKK